VAKTETLLIEGMDCASCTSKIETAVCKIPGVENVNLNYNTQKLKFDTGSSSADPKAVIKTIERLGYKVQKADKNIKPKDVSWWQTGKGRLVLFAGALLFVAMVLSFTFPAYADYVFTFAGLAALVPLARKAFLSTLAGQPFTIETLVTVAVIGAIFLGEMAEASIVVFLFLIGELLEMVAAAKARRSIQALTDLVPKSAFLVTKGDVIEVEADNLKVDDIIEIRPGGRIPADGEIIKGNSSVDEALVSGESMPKRKVNGDNVYAGSINIDGLLRVQVEKTSQNNMVARILAMVEDAEANKAPTARFIDRFSKYYTPGVFVVSFLIAVVPPMFFGGDFDTWIYKGLAILLIGCPCALVLSTPAAITSGISVGAKNGLLMKGGAVLEAIGRVTKVAFDKTGTLTQGTPKVTDVVTFNGTEKKLLEMAGAVEAGSSHPLAIAIIEEVKSRKLAIQDVTDSKALSGRGVEAKLGGKLITIASPTYAGEISKLSKEQDARIVALESEGKTVAVVLLDKKVLGAIALRDELRADASEAIKQLSDLDVSAIMLTGDNRHTGNALAKQIGIEVKAELLPQDKLDEIERLKKLGEIAMVGDGINDAPALARADVGIAMGGGTDVAMETADATLLHERVTDVPSLIRLSRATMRNIHQNITIALGLKAVFLITTLFDITTLWMAILADTGATVLVTINALRLLRYNFDAPEKQAKK